MVTILRRRSIAHQRMEGSDKLRQVSDLNLLGNGGAEDATTSSDSCHLGEHLRVWLEQAEGGSNTRGYTNHAKSIAKPGSGLGRKTTEGSNTGKTRSKVCHLVNLRVALGHGVTIGTQESSGRDAHQHCVLRGVSGPLEHVQHTLGHDEPAEDIDEGDESCTSSQSLDGVGGIEASTH